MVLVAAVAALHTMVPNGGDGGDGICLVRYKSSAPVPPSPSMAATGGTTTDYTINNNNYRSHKFTLWKHTI